MSGSKQLEQGHHQRAPQADDRRRDSPRTGWSNSYTKADALKAFLQIHLTHEVSLDNVNSHHGFDSWIFGAKMSQDVFELRMDAILEQCPGVIGIHDEW